MAILTDGEILEYIKTKEIVVEPFRPECLGSNSYDIHLGKKLGGILFRQKYALLTLQFALLFSHNTYFTK